MQEEKELTMNLAACVGKEQSDIIFPTEAVSLFLSSSILEGFLHVLVLPAIPNIQQTADFERRALARTILTLKPFVEGVHYVPALVHGGCDDHVLRPTRVVIARDLAAL